METPYSLEEALSRIRQRYGEGVVRRGRDPVPAGVWPTSLPVLDHLLPGGGLPKGRLTVLAGEGQRENPQRTTGRRAILQTLTCSASQVTQVAYVDFPATLDLGYLFDLGLNAENCLIARPPGGAIGPGLAMARTLLRAGVPWVGICFPAVLPPGSGWAHALNALVEAAWSCRGVVCLAAPAPLPAALAHASSLTLTCTPTGWAKQHGYVTGLRLVVGVTKNKLGAPGAAADTLVKFSRPHSVPDVVGVPTLLPTFHGQGYAVFADQVMRRVQDNTA
ncbi:MAG TPA: hypothetical protein VN193_02950 [Candidatus Angelobacter sp.]|jgi:hypothetical protein|nr:hypothetical protein [Candidatus Angelobacter sp.]